MDWRAGDEAHWLELLSNGTGCRGVAGSHQSGMLEGFGSHQFESIDHLLTFGERLLISVEESSAALSVTAANY